MSTQTTASCWICGSTNLKLVKPSNLKTRLESGDFAITDSRYGVTTDIFRCGGCGFLECANQADVLSFYQELQDPSYEEGRTQRSMQQKKLLGVLEGGGAGKRLLDIGAGSGMLVEQALHLGYKAEGVEPSQWLAGKAQELGLPVYEGAFPNVNTPGPYDVVTLVDVIEHVPNPVQLMAAIRDVLSPGGVLLIVTPDVGSLAARLLGWRWWHFRLAHIGYFNRPTLKQAIGAAGLQAARWGRPAWYFRGDYLFDRAASYLPLKVKSPEWLARTTIPLNLGDSMYVVCALKH